MAHQNIVFANQFGGGLEPGLLVYRPNIRRQHGYGLGAFLGGMFRRLIPFVKSVVLPHAYDGVKNVAKDVFKGKDFKESLKSNAIGVLKGVGQEVLNQTGSGHKRGRKRKAVPLKHKATKKRRTVKKAVKKKSKKTKSKRKKPLRKNNFVTLFD